MGLADIEQALKADYAERLAQIAADPQWIKTWDAEEKARREALTPERRELEDLRRENAALRDRIEHATKALAGDDCGYDS